MRRAARVDANHAPITQRFLELGCSVQSLAAVGCGCPDLLVGFRGRNYLVEVKNPEVNAASFTPQQVSWHTAWRGHVSVVWRVEDCARVLKAER